MKLIFTFFSFVGLLSFSLVNAHGQSSAWRVYYSPDKTFSVELPAPLTKVDAFEGEHGAYEVDKSEERGCCAYTAIETTPEDSRFGIIVLHKKAKGFEKINFDNEEILSFLALTLIGDDDFDSYMKKPSNIIQNGSKGREYFYVKKDTLNNVTQYGRGRIFVTKDKIYITVFVGKNEKDLKLPDATRFFDSFRIIF